jgi:hypothetical protein
VPSDLERSIASFQQLHEPPRKNALSFLFGAIAAGAGFSAATHFMHSSDDAESGEEAVRPEFDLVAELQDLRDQNADLLERVRALESPLDTPRVAADTSFEEFKQEIRALVTNAPPSKQVQPVLIADVENALSAIRKEEKQDDWQEQRITKLTDMLSLTSNQADEMRTLHAERAVRNEEMKRVWQETGNRQVVGAMKTENAATYREGLERVLTPTQLETFDASRPGDK